MTRNDRLWIALFSQSGSEIAEIMERSGKYPDLILCDKVRCEWHPRIKDRAIVIPDEVIQKIIRLSDKNTLVTLHGYLRIIKPEAVKEHMYNVHPGDIETYPELRGIHPQRKALDLGLPRTGVVIHRVDEGVDTGKVIASQQYVIYDHETEISLINNLRELSINMWCELLEDIL